jgi:hypothetical protein
MTPELAKVIVGLAWPFVALILALAYKPEILSLKALLSRLKKLKLWQVEVEVDPVLQQKAAEVVAAASPTSIELKELPGLGRTAAMGTLERELHANLKAIPENHQTDVLIRNLAQARLEATFGIIYAGIFGSQIMGLTALEARRTIPASEAYAFYQEFEKKYPEIYNRYGFPGWLGFMKQRGLVEAVGDDIRITPLGDDFLQWLRATKLSVNKAY